MCFLEKDDETSCSKDDQTEMEEGYHGCAQSFL